MYIYMCRYRNDIDINIDIDYRYRDVYIQWVRNCLGIFRSGTFLGCPVLDMFLVFCNIFELKSAISKVFATLLSLNLSWYLQHVCALSTNMVVCTI